MVSTAGSRRLPRNPALCGRGKRSVPDCVASSAAAPSLPRTGRSDNGNGRGMPARTPRGRCGRRPRSRRYRRWRRSRRCASEQLYHPSRAASPHTPAGTSRTASSVMARGTASLCTRSSPPCPQAVRTYPIYPSRAAWPGTPDVSGRFPAWPAAAEPHRPLGI